MRIGGMRHTLLRALLALLLAGPAAAPAPAQQAVPSDAPLPWNQPPDRAACPDQTGYLWLDRLQKPACIRYFSGGTLYGAPLAIIQFSGDRDDVMRLPPERIPKNTTADRTRDAERLARRAGVPWVFMARPGTYGSSGDHRARRQPLEFQTLDAAVDALVRTQRIGRIVLVGHSGGATAGAALLTLGRTDVACAVLTSGAFSLLERARMLGHSNGGMTDTTGSRNIYDPLEHVAGVVADARRRILLIGSPDDRNTPFALQQKFVDALRAAGHDATLKPAPAAPPEYHNLLDEAGPRAAAECAQDALRR